MQNTSKKATFLSIAGIIVIGFTIYSNSLNGAYVWDDNILVRDNVYIKNVQFLPELFKQDYGAGAGIKYGFYRPLQMVTHMTDYFFWGDNIKGYHVTNVALHILAAILLYCFVNILWKDALLARLTSLLFIAHPIHTESVCNITSRMDPLALVFMLACFISYIKFLRTGKIGIYVLMALSYSLALLSKESSLMIPALLLLYHYAFKEKFKLFPFLTIVILSIGYIFLRVIFLKNAMVEASLFTGAIDRIPGFFVAIAGYIRLLLAPFDLHAEYGDHLFQLLEPRAVLGIVLLCASVLYAVIIRKRNGLICFALLWFFASLLPTSGIYPIAFYMAEHYLYMPSIGFFLILAWVMCVFYRTNRLKVPTILLIIGMLSFYSFLTIRQNNYWNKPIAFYERTLEYDPNNSRIYDKLGVELYDAGRLEEAETAFNKALEFDPDNDSAMNNIGNAYYEMGLNDIAVKAYKSALRVNPRSARAYYNMANALFKIDRKVMAKDMLLNAIAEDPNYSDAYNNLGAIYGSLGNTEEAVKSFKEAIRIYPRHSKAYNNLALIYYREKEYSLALKYHDLAVQYGYRNPDLADALNPYRYSSY